MEDPIKIIHKYKNNNGRIQYHINIFIGDIVDENCMRILRKIKNLDLYTSLTSLETREIDILEKNYGEYWYEKFFNSYHINNTKELTLKNSVRMRELRSLYTEEWVNRHFVNYKKRLETTIFNYEYVVKEDRERRSVKRHIRRQQDDVEELLDYRTTGHPLPPALNDEQYVMSRIESSVETDNWCADNLLEEQLTESELNRELKKLVSKQNLDYSTDKPEDSESEDIELEDSELEDSESEDIDQHGGQGPDDDEFNANFDDPQFDEFDFGNTEDEQNVKLFEMEVEQDLEDVDLLFNDIDETDKNSKLTTREIKEAISNEQYDRIGKKIVDFDESRDNSMFDENLKDVITKTYITNQYLFKDDTIKTIRDKICCGFKNSNKFGENTYIIPSHQYLWSEYTYQGKIDRVMIGQKWIIRNDILKLDVEPNTNTSVYEELRGNLRALRDNIRRYGKIRREDDDNGILTDYEGYYTYNELYMVDVYNELGLNYDPNFEEQRNLIDVYLRIYFPKIRPEEFISILDFLNESASDAKKGIEKNKIRTVYDTIKNNLILENEPMRDIEITKKKYEKEYVKLFKENYVTQSFIRAYLLDRGKKIDLFRIFDNFILNENYPFIQYQPPDGTPRSRYNEKYLLENERKEIIMKWFENTPWGISFKVRVSDKSDYKYMAINLSDNGRIDYKIQWKEEDMQTVDDIDKTYSFVKDLIRKINRENERFGIKLKIPSDDQFKFAFINTIQKFELPDNFAINHNDLSEFSRYFFPYVALVIEPRKRQSKTKTTERDERSKFGTYLRYKRVSKYDNKTKIEHRIVFFMRNYEYNDQSLSNEISKEFNITEEQALEEINAVRERYPNIKKSRKVLKKLENIPKYKPPGIGVDIQGKTRNNYKMRIAGARDRAQLNRIITFMNILIYLYAETYLYKRPDRQRMKDLLQKLTKIARRRNKVDEIVNHETPIKSVKQMTNIDRKRLTSKTEDDQNQWTRDCQNSGEDKKRRPQQFLNVEELQKLGYVWNPKLGDINFGHYERKIMVDSNGRTDSNKKKSEVVLRAVMLPLDDSGNNYVYYTCGPEENGKHMYIGFLKSKNPYGEAKPCCFIKDQLYSKNNDKRNLFLKSIGLIQNDESEVNKIVGDQLYILQSSNKIQEGRFAFLPKYLDIFLNAMLNNERVIKNHYLVSTTTGYYFKYGTKQDEYRYLNAVGSVLDLSIEDLRNKLSSSLTKDKNQLLFTSLNNGDIRAQFGSMESYLTYINTNKYLEYPLLNDLICSPGVINKYGLNIIIFQRKIRIIRKSFEREKIREHYYIVCQNHENIEDLIDPDRETILIVKEGKNYYPIILVKKEDENTKEVSITKTFQYNSNPENIVSHIFKYYEVNCQQEFKLLIKEKSNSNLNAKETNKILISLGIKEYVPKYQMIDARFKCRYLITNAGYIIPVIPSGIVKNVNIISTVNNYLKDYTTTQKYLTDLSKLTKNKLKIKPIGVFYKDKRQKSYVISAIMTEGYDAVPIIERSMTSEYIKKEKLLTQGRPNDEDIDRDISRGKSSIVVDKRVYEVSKNKYETETYQLFRYHLSYFLNNTTEGGKFKKEIENIINSEDINKRERKLELKNVLYRMTNADLSKTFNQLISRLNKQFGGQDNVSDQSENQSENQSLESETSPIVRELNPLTQANSPISIIQEPDTIQIIPEDFVPGRRNNLRESFVNTDVDEFDYSEQINPLDEPFDYATNKEPMAESVPFPKNEKTWLSIMPDSKIIDYPSYILKNNREYCYINKNKDACNINKHCAWNNSKNLCLFNVKRIQLIDFINQVTEELIQNELRASEILRRGEYFVSNIVDYNVFTERPGERIVMASNSNLEKILSELFGKENIPRIGKKRYKFDNTQTYEQLNFDNPLKETSIWYIQNIIDNNNTVFRAFANTYYWLVHPYDEVSMRNIGYYSPLQTTLSNIYKSQVINWLLQQENQDMIQKISSYIRYNKVEDFVTKLSMDVNTISSGIVELCILSILYETIIYVNDEYFNVIYVLHPTQGIVYDYKKSKNKFTNEKYQSYKKVIDIRFRYSSNSNYPDYIDALYPKKNN
ncbi:putative early transcription factor large subunit [Acanthamoeba polyphaga mimivirus]|nr:putative early transcription factor large subunit [Mimivirus reunion]WMV61682.1 putative early transcription factor large subunit [Mimivirus sp.]WMV62659.1 putative early transcription factor large subunit [Acanthamoeba polyphaga mimivirus]WMV63636.1 putative early transcription factor large subunit [Mimivirus sp.]